MAQLGARLDGIEEVVGSNPIGSTNFQRSTQRRAQPHPQRLLPLMRVMGERPLFGRQVREKAQASDALGTDSLAVDPSITPYKVA